MTTSKQLTIFEGTDGSGKTTAARTYAAATSARYIHFPALPHITTGLARLYIEAMMPALLGYQDVVFDRSWLSEFPYGEVHRHGMDRLGVLTNRMLERVALRCGARVVHCDVPFDALQASFERRAKTELLASHQQAWAVAGFYRRQATALPTVAYDYTRMGLDQLMDFLLADRQNHAPHPLEVQSAGNWTAPILLVGENFAERKNQDPWLQYPFVSFSGHGCSRWLAGQLETARVSERQLLWVNADQPFDALLKREGKLVVALGREAAATLAGKTDFTTVEHPAFWRRFHPKDPYPLLDLLKGQQ